MAGNYSFTGIPYPATIYVVSHSPVGLGFTTQDVGSDAYDSDIVPSIGRTAVFTPTIGESIDLDVGLIGTAPTFGWARPWEHLGRSELLSSDRCERKRNRNGQLFRNPRLRSGAGPSKSYGARTQRYLRRQVRRYRRLALGQTNRRRSDLHGRRSGRDSRSER